VPSSPNRRSAWCWRLAAGELVDLQAGDSREDDLVNASRWDARRLVRAGLVASLLTGKEVSAAGPVRAVRLRGARITGCLEDDTLICPLVLEKCAVDEPVNLRGARARTVRLIGCRLPGSPQTSCGQTVTSASTAVSA
jgi:hypothetical protein